jgi:hypothetical protein
LASDVDNQKGTGKASGTLATQPPERTGKASGTLADLGAAAIHASLRRALNCFKWGLIASLLTGLGVWLYIDRHVDDEIRRQAEAWLAARFPHLAVSVEGARLVDGEGITLRGVRLRDPLHKDGDSSDLATIDEIALDCDTSLPRLIQGDVDIRHVVLRRPRVCVARTVGGEWNVSQWLAGESSDPGRRPPSAQIEGGTLEFLDATRNPPARWSLREIDLDIGPSAATDQAMTDGGLRVSGRFSGDHLRQAQIAFDYHPSLKATGGTITLLGTEISPAMLAALPREAAQHAKALAALQARADVTLKLAYASGQQQPWRFDAQARIYEGRLEHARLPYPLGQLQARLHVHDGGWKIEDLSASHRQTALQLSAERRGWLATSPLTVQLAGRQLLFDQRILDALPKEAQDVWREFSPEGEADVDLKLTFDGRAWHPDVTITARGVAVTYFRFPYQVQQAEGVLKLNGKHLSLDLSGKARGVPVYARGEIHDFGLRGAGQVHIYAKKLRSDPEMIAALPPEPRATVQSFRAAGVVDLDLWLWWQPDDPVIHQKMRLLIHEAQARYEGFPYGVVNVRGLLEQLSDDEWRFSDLVATNGDGRITCSGTMKPVDLDPNRSLVAGQPAGAAAARDQLLELNFTGSKITLNDELRDALPADMRSLWINLRPQGIVDLEDVKLQLLTGRGDKRLSMKITPRDETVSIEPTAFPYRWDKLRGQISYDNGVVDLRDVHAAHGDTAWRSHGQASLAADGGWAMSLDRLHVDHLHVDRDLLRAAPEGLRQALGELNPAGAFNLYGRLSFAQGASPNEPLRSKWSLDVVCHRNSLRAGLKLDDLFGTVRLEGQSERGDVWMNGQLALESLTCRGFQLTDVQGPFSVQPGLILLGSPHQRQPTGGAKRISARCYGGTLQGDAWVRRDAAVPPVARGETAAAAPWKFALRAGLAQMNLGRFSREALVGRQNISGRADGDLLLEGTSQGARDLKGEGNVHLRDANIYELPVMLSLLKVLSLKEPDLTAFTTSDVRFAINGDHGQVYFPRIDLNGDALSLSGRGSMSFDRQLALVFRPQLGRSGASVPILSNLLRSASSQIVELYVGGTPDQPDVSREPFPAIKDALENLQAPILPGMPHAQRP